MNKAGTKSIITKRLVLRPFRKEDALEVYENYGSDINITKYISWIPCDTMDKCEEFLDFNVNSYKDNPLHFSWAITLDDVIVGSIAIFNVDESNDSGELGYSLGSKWWNQGLITEAGRSVLDYAFNVVGFNRVFASCHEDNIGSKRVLEKLSMSFEGTLRDGQRNLDNTYSNLDLYSILKREYDNK